MPSLILVVTPAAVASAMTGVVESFVLLGHCLPAPPCDEVAHRDVGVFGDEHRLEATFVGSDRDVGRGCGVVGEVHHHADVHRVVHGWLQARSTRCC